MKKIAVMILCGLLMLIPAASAYKVSIEVRAGSNNTPPTITLLEKKVFEYLNGPELTGRTYLFTGEVVQDKVRVCDSNGKDDIKNVELWLDSTKKVTCDKYNSPSTSCEDYKCIYMVGTETGEKDIIVKAFDNDGGSDSLPAQGFWFNPQIRLQVTTTSSPSYLKFPGGTPGTTVNAVNGLYVKNIGQNDVSVDVWVSGSNLYGTTVALCPTSNVLDVANIEYEVAGGPIVWTELPMYDINKPYGDGDHIGVLAKNQQKRLDFRLNYPTPCIGTFSGGKVYFVAEPN